MTNFIPLEMTDEVPAGATWQERDLCASLLNATFAEEKLAGLDCLEEEFGGMRFRDGEERDFCVRPMGALGGVGDGGVSSGESISEGGH